jgi:hypothetical protein
MYLSKGVARAEFIDATVVAASAGLGMLSFRDFQVNSYRVYKKQIYLTQK